MAVVRVVWDLDVPEMNEWEPAEEPAMLRQIDPGEWYYDVISGVVSQYPGKERTKGVHLPVRRKWKWLDCLRPEIVAVARDENGAWWGFSGLCLPMENGATAGRWLSSDGVAYPLVGIDPSLMPAEPDWRLSRRLRPGWSPGDSAVADNTDTIEAAEADVPVGEVVPPLAGNALLQAITDALADGCGWDEIARRVSLPESVAVRRFEGSVGPLMTRDLRAYFAGVAQAIRRNWSQIMDWDADVADTARELSGALGRALYSHSKRLRDSLVPDKK